MTPLSTADAHGGVHSGKREYEVARTGDGGNIRQNRRTLAFSTSDAIERTHLDWEELYPGVTVDTVHAWHVR